MNEIITGIKTLPAPYRRGEAILLGEKLGENAHAYVPVLLGRGARVYRQTVKYGTLRKWPDEKPSTGRYDHYCIAKKPTDADLTSVILRINTRWTSPISGISSWGPILPRRAKPIKSVTVRSSQGGWMDSLVEMKDGDIIVINPQNKHLPTRYVLIQKYKNRALRPMVLTQKDIESYNP
jgi:hypothetical protein